MKTILITGITGKSGQHLLKHLVANADSLSDYHFRFTARDTSKIPSQLPLHHSVVEGDLASDDGIQRFLQNADSGFTLLHIADVGLSLKLVKAAIAAGAKRLILVHTTGIYSKYKKAGNFYRDVEWEIYEMLRGTDIALTILRPTMIYGNIHDHTISVFIRMVDKLRYFPVVDGARFALQPVWCGDLGRAYYDVLMHPRSTHNKNYILSGGEAIDLIDIFRTIEHQLGKPKPRRYISVPFWIAYSGAVALWCLSLGKIDFRERVQRLVEPRCFNHQDATTDFGYSPTDFATGIRDEIEEYRQSITEASGRRANR